MARPKKIKEVDEYILPEDMYLNDEADSKPNMTRGERLLSERSKKRNNK